MSLALKFRRPYQSVPKWQKSFIGTLTLKTRWIANPDEKLFIPPINCLFRQSIQHNSTFIGCKYNCIETTGPNRFRSIHTPSTGILQLGELNKDKEGEEVKQSPIDYLENINAVLERIINKRNSIFTQYDQVTKIDGGRVTQDMITQLLNILKECHQINNTIIVPKQNKRRDRFSNLSDEGDVSLVDHIDDLLHLKEKCAQVMNDILGYHIKYNIPSKHLIMTNDKDDAITLPFSLVMDAWNQSNSFHCGSKTAEVLDSWGEIYGGDMNLAPTINEFNIVLDAYAKAASKFYETGNKSLPGESAWDIYSFLCQLNDVMLLPNVASCAHTINALSHHAFTTKYSSRDFQTKLDGDVAAIKAFSIWKQMLEKLEHEPNADKTLIWRAHNDIIALSSHGMLRRDKITQKDNILATVGRDTEDLFNIIQKKIPREERCQLLNISSNQAYLSTMLAWTKEQEENIAMVSNENISNNVVTAVTRAASSVDSLLRKMKENNLNPTPEHYHAVIKAYFNCLHEKVLRSDIDGTVRGELLPYLKCFELIEEMEEHCIPSQDKESFKSPITEKIVPASMYETVIRSFTRTFNDDKELACSWVDIEKANLVLNCMMDLHERNLLWIEKNQQPLTFALNQVLKLYSQFDGNGNEIYQKANVLMRRFHKIRSKQRPNENTFSTYLTILSRSNRKDAVPKVLYVLNDMKKNGIEPNIHTYTIVIQIIANNGDKTGLGQQMIQRAFEKYYSLRRDEQKECVFNAAALYSSLISGKIKSGNDDPEEALNMLNSLKKMHDESKDPNLRPDAILYGAVLDSISRNSSKDAIQTSLQLLDEMESMYHKGVDDLIPTNHCYTSVIKTISSSGISDAPRLIEVR
jgi:hypothetical protein